MSYQFTSSLGLDGRGEPLQSLVGSLTSRHTCSHHVPETHRKEIEEDRKRAISTLDLWLQLLCLEMHRSHFKQHREQKKTNHIKRKSGRNPPPESSSHESSRHNTAECFQRETYHVRDLGKVLTSNSRLSCSVYQTSEELRSKLKKERQIRRSKICD